MAKQQESSLSLDDLKAIEHPQGFLLYTTAKVEDKTFTFEGPISVDQVLMNLGYCLDPATDRPGVMTFADREVEGRREVVRYHPLAEGDPQETRQLEMKTRVNFLGWGPSDAIYDVAKAFLDKGHSVAVPPLQRNFDRLHRFKPGENRHYLSEVILLSTSK